MSEETPKEYLKMADVFRDDVQPERFNYAMANPKATYAAHAINSHDELVAEVERLRESNKRMADSIWRKAIDNWHQVKDMGLTQERFIEQYCCFPHPEQK